ncbi:MAG: hypothetical protein GY822_10665 [Deltaproteobacteria bacterium]|nr:hypothetical protein [Deltaproteobacteria bacterium]
MSFLDGKRSEPVLSSSMRARQRRLSQTEATRIHSNFALLSELMESSKSFRAQLKRRRDLVQAVLTTREM